MTQSSETKGLAIPGVVQVASGGVVHVGAAAGWITTGGIRDWSQELSLIARSDLTDAVREELGLTLPEHRIAPRTHPLAHRAAQSLTLLAVTSDAAPKLLEKGIRVHTVGFDRVTGGFMYFAKGGKGEPLEIHGDLLEIIEPTLESGASSNEDIEKHLDRFIDRVLLHFSGGTLDEQKVELANALPRLASDARGMQGVDLDAFEAEAAANEASGKKFADGAKKLASTLQGANGSSPVKVPLYGEALKKTQPAMDVKVAGNKTSLPARGLWIVSGEPKEMPVEKPVEKPAVAAAARASTPTPAPVSAPKAASPKPAPVEPKPTPKPAVVEAKAASPKPAPVEAKPVVEVKPIVAAPVVAVGAPAPAPEKVAEKPKAAAPGTVIGVGVVNLEEPKPAPEPAKAEAAPAPEPAKVEEPKPEKKAEEPKPEKKAEEPKPEKKAEAKPKAEEKPKPEEKPVKAKEEAPVEKAPPPPAEAPKSNAMVFVILAIVIVAAIAFFMMKKH